MRSFVPDFDLVSATALEHATDLLSDGWRPIAGGTDLMVLFNAGKLPYRKLVSLRRIEELLDITVRPDEVSIGAAVTYTRIRQHAVLQREFPALCLAASWTGSIANQNRGTLAGNIVNASPAADSAPVLLAYDAEVELVSARAARRIPYREFHLGYKEMQLRHDELLHSIHLSRANEKWRHYARKVGTRRAQAISKISFIGLVQMSGDTIDNVRLAAGSVAPVPLRCYRTEESLRGERISSTVIHRAAATISSEVQPITDIRSTIEYRRTVMANLLADFLKSLR
ncbi:MAG TPA: xanthine dehydrogenase family protein subunit M [Bryobacteraceae bacterium]|nr:xanthine dehydrogenase family protein subunit M [Bryobacteraceae bacterium]